MYNIINISYRNWWYQFFNFQIKNITSKNLFVVDCHWIINIQTHVDKFVVIIICKSQFDDRIIRFTKNLIIFVDKRDDWFYQFSWFRRNNFRNYMICHIICRDVIEKTFSTFVAKMHKQFVFRREIDDI